MSSFRSNQTYFEYASSQSFSTGLSESFLLNPNLFDCEPIFEKLCINRDHVLTAASPF